MHDFRFFPLCHEESDSVCQFAWYLGFFHNAIVPRLSSLITVAPFCPKLKSRSRALNRIASCVRRLAATYSASVEERATVDCFLLLQLALPPHIVAFCQQDRFPNLRQCGQ